MKRVMVGENEYVLVVLKQIDVDEFGRPKTVVIGYDDTKFDLKGGEHFYTGYVSKACAETNIKGKA